MIYSCKYCSSKFSQEEKFKNHKCDKIVKLELMKTNSGRTSLMYYSEWRRMKGYSSPSEDTFIDSRYFTSLYKFVEYSKKMHIPTPIDYIKYMIDKNLLPQYWYNDNIYIDYIQHYDEVKSPLEQFYTSVKTLHSLARRYECDLIDVIPLIKPGQMFKLLQARELSPWLLLFTKKFQVFIYKLNTEQNIRLQSIITPQLWKTKFEKNLDTVRIIQKYILENKL